MRGIELGLCLNSMTFVDHFGAQASLYATFRPGYPKELYSFLCSLVESHDLALDCATGNGQAAVDLAPYFKKVVAFDGSQAQLERAVRNPKVEYQLATAENFHVSESSVDLVTIASGVHWFDREVFFKRVKKILKPHGVVAAWVYCGWSSTSDLAQILHRFEQEVVGPYFPHAFQKSMKTFYESLDFPFEELPKPEFFLDTQVSKDWVLGYLKTWSGTQRFIDQNKQDPTVLIGESLSEVFRASENVDLRFHLALRVGRQTV